MKTLRLLSIAVLVMLLGAIHPGLVIGGGTLLVLIGVGLCVRHVVRQARTGGWLAEI